MTQTNALHVLGKHNIILETMTTRQLEAFIDGSSAQTLREVRDASQLVNHRVARRLAVECDAELRRQSFSRKH